MSRNTVERRELIKELLIKNGSINSSDASSRFSVSTETIRKDLIFLEREGIAKKSYGGAVISTDYIETPVDLRNDKNVESKTRIAKKAMEFVPQSGVILLDAGSTTSLLAKELFSREGLTVITNSISVCNILCSSKNMVYILGGQVKNVTMSLVGLWANSALSSVNIDVAFLGTSGFASFSGPSAESFPEAELKKHILTRCNQSIVLADSSKCKTNALTQYAQWSEVDYLIIDNPIDKELCYKLQQSVSLILA